jgi:FMN phosphatase YigB (HAD superfamily)
MSGIILDLDGVGYRLTREFNRGKDRVYAFAAAAAATRQSENLSLDRAKSLAKQSYSQTGSELTAFYDMGFDRVRLFQDFHEEAFDLLQHNISKTKGLTKAFRQAQTRGPIAILSHSARNWTDQVLERIGIADQVDPRLIFTLEDPRINFVRKSQSAQPFLTVCAEMGSRPESTAMVEDDAKNLVKAHEAGLKTVLISAAKNPKKPAHVDHVHKSVVSFLVDYKNSDCMIG